MIVFSLKGMEDPAYFEFKCAKSIVLALGALTSRGWSNFPEKNSPRIILFM